MEKDFTTEQLIEQWFNHPSSPVKIIPHKRTEKIVCITTSI